MTRKSLFVTYLLWIFGGFFGIHHLYLGRDEQALIWWLFCGGGFGIGWFRDLWRIPDYVNDANDDAFFIEKLTLKMRKYKKPPFSIARFACQQVVAESFGFLALNAVPKDFFSPIAFRCIIAVLVPFATAVGTYIVGNIGRQEGSFKSTVRLTLLAAPLFIIIPTPSHLTVWISTLCFDNYVKKWRRTPKHDTSVKKRVKTIALCASLYFALWGCYLHFNCMIMVNEAEGMKCSDALANLFRDFWRAFAVVLRFIVTESQTVGWEAAWKNFVDQVFRNTGTLEALQVLNLTSSATQQEITARYRELVRYYHPDRNKDPEKAQYYADKFMEIQQAYEILSDVKLHRIDKNVRDPTANDTFEE